MFKSVGSLIYKLPNKGGAREAISALLVRQVAKEAIDRELVDFGQEVLLTIKVKSFKKGVLTVSAAPMVAAELHMRSGGLIRDINKKVRGKVLRRILFRVG
jgi:hypothetical protein